MRYSAVGRLWDEVSDVDEYIEIDSELMNCFKDTVKVRGQFFRMLATKNIAHEVSGDRAVINRDDSGRYAIMSPVNVSALSIVTAKPAENYRIHAMVHGDTLRAITKKYLGNGSRYKEIVNLNGLKSNVLSSGMKLKIPNK